MAFIDLGEPFVTNNLGHVGVKKDRGPPSVARRGRGWFLGVGGPAGRRRSQGGGLWPVGVLIQFSRNSGWAIGRTSAWISPLPRVASCRSLDRSSCRRRYQAVEGRSLGAEEGRFLPTRACAWRDLLGCRADQPAGGSTS